MLLSYYFGQRKLELKWSLCSRGAMSSCARDCRGALLLITPAVLTFQFIEACNDCSLFPEFCAFFCRRAPLVSRNNMNAGVFIHAR